MKINKLIITIIATAFIFMGCSNSLDSAPSASGSYSVTGKISFAGSSGAAPVVFTPALDGRTATASFNNEHLSLNLYAYKYNEQTQSIDTRKKHDNVVVDQSGNFVFCFEEKGRYIIYAEVLRNGKKCATGTTKVEITGYTPNSISISTSPNVSEDGKIQLSVSAATDITPQIKKVSVSWISSFSGHVEENADGTHESSEYEAAMLRRDDVLNGKYNKSFDVVNGTATISYDAFPGGNWLAKISFEDETENSLYSCQEIINVYPTFTTNRWYGSSPAINNGSFKVTKTMVTIYDADRIPNTNYVLYNNASGNYQYYIKSSPAETVSGTADISVSSDSFCFDVEGNFYSLDISTDTYPSRYTIYKNKEQHATFEDTYGYVYSIAVDLATNTMYTWAAYENNLYINKYPNLILSGDVSEPVSYTINHPRIRIDDENYCDTFGADLCTIYNGIAYVIESDHSSDGWGAYICKAPLQNTNFSIAEEDCVNLELNYYGLSNARIQDMIYQDGSVYILYKESDTYKSRGALIKYDTTTDDINVIGYSDAVKENSELADVMLQAYDREYNGNNTFNHQLFTDAAATIPLYVPANTSFIDSWVGGQLIIYGCFSSALYTPAPLADSLSEDAFYGPVKFIAIKPKKLVIADDGIAFYTDSEGVLKYKNVNRVVTVDLDTFSLEIQSAGVSFDSDSTDKKTFFSTGADSGYSNALEAYISTTTPAYYENGEQLTSRSNTYLAIPCGD